MRAIVHEPVFADIKKTSARAAVPTRGKAPADVVLKAVEMREGEERCLALANLIVDGLLRRGQRCELAGLIMQPNSGLMEPPMQ